MVGTVYFNSEEVYGNDGLGRVAGTHGLCYIILSTSLSTYKTFCLLHKAGCLGPKHTHPFPRIPGGGG